MAASYPGSVKTFATRSAGQTIDASHVNDLQDEVNAIEAGLLNGTAPLNSSGSTVATLSVLSHSTIAGSLHVVGNSTFDGNLVVTGTLTGGSQTAPACKLSHDAVQTLSSGAWTGLSWNTEGFDSSTGMHSTATNSSRITFADSTGRYAVGFAVEASTNAGGGDFLQARIMFNDSSVVVRVLDIGAGSAGILTPLTAESICRAASTTDYVTVQVYAGGSTNRVAAESTGAACGFWAFRISA